MQIDGIIFDLDGLMIDSEDLHFEAWLALLADHNATLTDDDYQTMIGMDGLVCARYVLDRTGVHSTPQQLLEHRWGIAIGLLQQGIEPAPGLIDLLAELEQRQLALAVASNSPLAYTRQALITIGLADRFSCVLTADQVAEGKPAPDVYRAAAACLGIAPERCLALEDSPIGMQAALAAGMHCIAVPNAAFDHAADFDSADAVFASLPELSAKLDRVLNGG